jgi:hypothetical protein
LSHMLPGRVEMLCRRAWDRSVSVPKAHQLSVVSVVEGAAYECGQLSEQSGCWCGETFCRIRAEIWEAAAYVPPGRKCGSVGGCEGVQVGGGRREYSGGSRGRGQKGADDIR